MRFRSISTRSSSLNVNPEARATTSLYQKRKGGIRGWKRIPFNEIIRTLLEEIRTKQAELNIKSDFIFCHENGEWIKTDAYITFLRRLCRSLGLKVTHNHVLRMSLNSNVLLPLDVSVADRAAMLRHSIQTNQAHYFFANSRVITRTETSGNVSINFFLVGKIIRPWSNPGLFVGRKTTGK